MVQTTARDLHGRRALVSGGTKGAGAAIARRLEAAGATVLVTARSQPRDLDPELFIAADLTSVVPNSVSPAFAISASIWPAWRNASSMVPWSVTSS